MENNERINTNGTVDSTGGMVDIMLNLLPVKQVEIDNFRLPDGYKMAVNFTVDFDAMLARKQMQDPILPVTKGEFGGRVGIWRLIELFGKHDVKATFFTPGRICELYPDALSEALRQGHELADHTWEHQMMPGPEWEKDHLLKGTNAIEKISGKKPVGTRSIYNMALLKELGYKYISIQGDNPPCWAYDAKGNYMLNLPFHWGIDDAMFYSFRIFGSPLPGHRLESPDKIFDVWLKSFRYFYKSSKYMDICLHPFVSGRSLRIAMLDRLISEMKKMPGVWFPTCAELTEHCYENFSPPEGTG